MSAISALNYIKKEYPHENIIMIGDSNYVRLGITEYIHKRVNNGWKLANKSPVLNQDLRKELYDLTKNLSIERQRVKGHSTDKHNNEADKVARKMAGIKSKE